MALIYKVKIEEAPKENLFRVTWENGELGEHDYFDLPAEITAKEAEELWQYNEHQVTIGEKLFRFLDGDARLFHKALENAFNKGTTLEIHLKACPKAADWPFELLALNGEFLLIRKIHLVRLVSEYGINHDREPQKRPLKLFFMASSPKDVKPLLDYENEERAIFRATAKLPIHIEVNDMGSLEALHGQLLTEQFDVVHLSGHADKESGTPIFLMEDKNGLRHDVNPDDLWDDALIENPPILLFLSGCRTGEAPNLAAQAQQETAPGSPAAASFARYMVDNFGIPAVLGWGRSVSDVQSTAVTEMIYRELSRGRSFVEAIQRARVKLHNEYRNEPFPAWPLLRLFCNGIASAPVVEAEQAPMPVPLAARRAGDRFSGRRRQLQTAFKCLTDKDDKYGVLILGADGLGKSRLAQKIQDRFQGYGVIIVRGELNRRSMRTALSEAFIAAGDQDGQQVISNNREMSSQFELLCPGSFRNKNYLIILDDFDCNLERLQNGRPGRLTLEAVEILKPLLRNIHLSGKMTQLIITSRRAFTLTDQNVDLVSANLENIYVNSFREAELQKLLWGLEHLAAIPEQSRREKLMTASFGNPRLLETFNEAVGISGITDEDQLNAMIKRTRDEFVTKGEPAELLKGCPTEMLDFLACLSIFRHPVDKNALRRVSDTAGVNDMETLLKNAVAIGLIEHYQDRDTFQVYPPIRAGLVKRLNNEKDCHKAALQYYLEICISADSVNMQSAMEYAFHYERHKSPVSTVPFPGIIEHIEQEIQTRTKSPSAVTGSDHQTMRRLRNLKEFLNQMSNKNNN